MAEYSDEELLAGLEGFAYDDDWAKLDANVDHLQDELSKLRSDMNVALARLVKIERLIPAKGLIFAAYGIVSALLAALILFRTVSPSCPF
jgi:hypothetical protein